MFRCRELAAFSSLILLLSCGGQEQQALSTFFDAVQSGDNTALAAVSAVEMPVKVQSWEIIEIEMGNYIQRYVGNHAKKKSGYIAAKEAAQQCPGSHVGN